MSMIMTDKELKKRNWRSIEGFIQDRETLLRIFVGKTIKSVDYLTSESEALVITFTDNTCIMIESYAYDENSDWVESTLDVYLPRTDDMTEYGFLKDKMRKKEEISRKVDEFMNQGIKGKAKAEALRWVLNED